MNGHERHGTSTKNHKLGQDKVLWSEKVYVNVQTCIKVIYRCEVSGITFKEKMYQRPNNALRGHQQLIIQVLVQQLSISKPRKVLQAKEGAYKAKMNTRQG